MSTKVTYQDVENVFFPLFDKLLKIASYRHSKKQSERLHFFNQQNLFNLLGLWRKPLALAVRKYE